jgi:hypothetical protein
MRRKKFTECAVVSSRHRWTNSFRPLDTGRSACYFRPASGIDRSTSWCRFPRRGARSARSILASEALPGRRVPERPARPCGLEPADAGGPGTWGRRPRTAGAAAARRTPLEIVEKVQIVEKVLTNTALLMRTTRVLSKRRFLRDGRAAAYRWPPGTSVLAVRAWSVLGTARLPRGCARPAPCGAVFR